MSRDNWLSHFVDYELFLITSNIYHRQVLSSVLGLTVALTNEELINISGSGIVKKRIWKFRMLIQSSNPTPTSYGVYGNT